MKGNIQEVSTLFQDRFLKGLLPDAEIYNMLIQGHCQVKNMRKVEKLLGIITNGYSTQPFVEGIASLSLEVVEGLKL